VSITFDNSVFNSASSPSCSATLAVGGAGATVVAIVLGGNAGTPTVTCGGTAMSLLGTIVTATGNNVYAFYLAGVGSGSKTISATTASGAYNRSEITAASWLGVSSVSTGSWAVATGSGTTPTASTLSVNTTDFVVSLFATSGSYTETANTGTLRVQGSGLNAQDYNRNSIVDGTGATSITNKVTMSQSAVWAVGSLRLVGVSSWTGGASGSQTATGTADGAAQHRTGAAGSATVSESAEGTRTAKTGASSAESATGTADGAAQHREGASGSATASGSAEGTDQGVASGHATASGSASGELGVHGGAAGSAAAVGAAEGGMDWSGDAESQVTGTGTADGVDTHSSGAEGDATATGAADGTAQHRGGATGSATATGTTTGTPGGSAKSEAIAWGSGADGFVRHADGRLDLTETDPVDAFARANEFFADHWTPPTSLDVRLHDVNGYQQMGLGDYISTTCTFDRNVPGPGTIQLKGTDPGGKLAMTCKYATVPVTIRTDNWKWTGRVKDCTDDTVGGVNTYSLQLIDDLSWAGKMLVFPTWWSPVEFQPITKAFYIGPAVSCIKNMFSEQIMRLYYLDLVYDLINNIGQPAAMLATLLSDIERGDFMAPIVVVPTDMLTDTSKWTCVDARMVTCDTVIAATLKDCGLRLKIWMWEEGDPQPTTAFTLHEPTIVIDVVDETNVQGITGTALDGLIGTAVEFADTSFGAIMTAMTGIDYNLSQGTDNTNPYEGIFSDWLGLNSKPPWVIYEDGPHSSIKESHVGAHTPLAYTVMTGGSSPSWVNDLLDLLLEALLSAILAYAGISGVADNILDGILDNIILAFMQVEDVQRRLDAGKFAWPEALTTSGGTAWTPDALIALEEGLWDTRGQYTFQFIVPDGYPYTFGKDHDIGHAVSFIYKNVIYTDYLDTAVFTDDRNNCIESVLTVGDNNPLESPWAKLARYVQGVDDVVKFVTLQGTS